MSADVFIGVSEWFAGHTVMFTQTEKAGRHGPPQCLALQGRAVTILAGEPLSGTPCLQKLSDLLSPSVSSHVLDLLRPASGLSTAGAPLPPADFLVLLLLEFLLLSLPEPLCFTKDHFRTSDVSRLVL